MADTQEYNSIAEELEAMIAGTHVSPEEAPEPTEADVNPDTDKEVNEQTPEVNVNEEGNINDEDTENTTSTEEEPTNTTDTKDISDGEDSDTAVIEGDTPVDADSENTPVDEGSKQGEDEGKDKDSKASDEPTGTDTKSTDDGSDKDTGEPDYKAKYEELLKHSKERDEFYDIVTADFKANGRIVKGFKDPKKIVQSNQMATGYSDKMAGFKKYRPFQAPLEERGMLEDKAKFDLAMHIIDGDKEAIKQHLKNLNIDPVTDLDTKEINYVAKSTTKNDVALNIEDMLDTASNLGMRDKLEDVLFDKWDSNSAYQLVNDPASRKHILEHMESGLFDAVQERINENKRTDIDGSFSSQDSITQYRISVEQLGREYAAQQKAQQAQAPQTQVQAQAQTQKPAAPKAPESTTEFDAKAEIERLKQENARLRKAKEDAYKAKLERENKVAEEARKKAATASERRPKPQPKKEIDPMDLSGDAFRDYFNQMIMG
jgi:hypothetical protein